MKDMTTGNSVKLIIGFTIPMLIGNIFQQLYNIVDTLIVGRYLGNDALAGVGSTGTLTFFMLCFIYGLGNGAGLVIAQCFGSKDFNKLRSVVVALTWVSVIMILFVTVLGLTCSGVFLRWLSVPDNVMPYSQTYLKIIFSFIIGSVVYNAVSAILRSVGDSKTPLYALIIASIVNIALDIVFILYLNLGVAGVAYATIISQVVSALITLFYLLKNRREIGLTNINWRPEGSSIVLIIKTGFPSAFQSCLISLGGMSVQRLINSYGSTVMAAYVAANRIDSLAIQVVVSISTALSVFTGQNFGRNQFDRIREALYKVLVIMILICVVIAGSVLIFRYQLVGLFLDASEGAEAIEIATTYLSIIGVAYIIAGVMQTYQGVIRGAGDVNICMIAGMTELAGRIIFAYLLSHFLGPTGIWIATPLSWFCGCVIPVHRYYSGKWKLRKLI